MYALVVDDEDGARETVIQMVKLYCPQIRNIEEAHNVQTAIASIEQKQPDILFLDIRLGDGNGFDVLKNIDSSDLSIIFLTTYEEYAVKAFKVSAVDYLLKPLDPDELIEAVEKVYKSKAKDVFNSKLNRLLEQVEENRVHKITLKTMESIHIVETKDIIFCGAEKNYTTFFLVDGRQIIVSKTLREYEALFSPKEFMRTHQSYLVNLNHIVQYDKGDKNYLVMTGAHKVPVAIRKKEQVMQFFKDI